MDISRDATQGAPFGPPSTQRRRSGLDPGFVDENQTPGLTKADHIRQRQRLRAMSARPCSRATMVCEIFPGAINPLASWRCDNFTTDGAAILNHNAINVGILPRR
jgi:hypothetical protein